MGALIGIRAFINKNTFKGGELIGMRALNQIITVANYSGKAIEMDAL